MNAHADLYDVKKKSMHMHSEMGKGFPGFFCQNNPGKAQWRAKNNDQNISLSSFQHKLQQSQ